MASAAYPNTTLTSLCSPLQLGTNSFWIEAPVDVSTMYNNLKAPVVLCGHIEHITFGDQYMHKLNVPGDSWTIQACMPAAAAHTYEQCCWMLSSWQYRCSRLYKRLLPVARGMYINASIFIFQGFQ
jgi:hypothetical protein